MDPKQALQELYASIRSQVTIVPEAWETQWIPRFKAIEDALDAIEPAAPVAVEK